MTRCAVCSKHGKHPIGQERVFEAVKQWLWEDAPYLLQHFVGIKYSLPHNIHNAFCLKNREDKAVCRTCVIKHTQDWLIQLEAPRGVMQRFNTYFAPQIHSKLAAKMVPATKQNLEKTRKNPPQTQYL